ncbi:MAG: diacylglycerol kinase family lipid kinase [Lachnospiraceae bacterium]|nr:diacylglycerol kinase family lipid kinase [Candidatus Colinaster scatohippi]
MKKLLFVYNQHSGRGKIKYHLMDIIDTFVKEGYEVTAYPTQYSGDAKRIVMEKSSDYDMVICSGGDGTLDEVVTGMKECGNRLPVGYIPSGSTNDFANSLGIPKSMTSAAKVAIAGKPYATDIGRFNEDIFVYVAAFGMFAEVSYDTDQHMKNLLGHMAYIIEGAKRLPSVSFYHFVIDYIDEEDKHHRLENDYLLGMITNSKSVGGFKNITGKNVTLDDGIFEVTLVRRTLTPLELVELAEAIDKREMDMNLVTTFRAKQITFASDGQVAWTLDGEFGGEHSRVEIVNEQKELTIMVPDKKEKTRKLVEKITD